MTRGYVRSLRRAAAAVSLVLVLAACSDGSTSKSDAGSASPTSSCSLGVREARGVIGDASVSSRLPTIPGMPDPVERCQYENGDRTVQLTVFPGDDMFRQLGVMVSKAQLEPTIGSQAYCGGSRGTKLASFSCLFTHESKTYVLALNVPNTEDTDALHGKLRSVAESLVDRGAEAPT